MRTIGIATLVGFMLFIMAACSSSPKPLTHISHYFKFDQVSRFSTYAPNSAFYQHQSIADDVRNSVEIILENSFAKQNIHYTTLDDADVIVTYHFDDGDQQALAQYNKLVHLCVVCEEGTKRSPAQVPQPAAIYGAKQRAKSAKESRKSDTIAETLILDLIDPKTSRSVWRQKLAINLKAKDNSQERQAKIRNAIEQMLTKYPTNSK